MAGRARLGQTFLMKILLAILLACAFVWHLDALAQGTGERYAIKLSESPQAADLTPLRDRVQSVARIPARVYEVKDAGGATIHVLAAGEYATMEEAATARAGIAEKLGLPAGALAIVPLPR